MFFPFRNLLDFYREAYWAITDFTFYRSILNQPWRRTLVYLLYLSAHLALLLAVTYAVQYASDFSRFSKWAQNTFPPLEVKNGELSINGEQPAVHRYQGKQDVTFVFDTTGKYSTPDGFTQPVFLLTRRNILFSYEGQTQSHSWTEFGAFKLDRSRLEQFERFAKIAYFPVAYSVLLVYHMLAKSFTAIFISTFALFSAARYGLRLPFRSTFTLGLYGLTPAVVIALAVTATGIYISYFFAIYLAIAAIYTFMATARSVDVE